MIRLVMLGIELLFASLDQLFDKHQAPAGPEVGCDDDGAWCPGTESAERERFPVYISAPLTPAEQIAALDYASLAVLASASLGPTL